MATCGDEGDDDGSDGDYNNDDGGDGDGDDGCGDGDDGGDDGGRLVSEQNANDAEKVLSVTKIGTLPHSWIILSNLTTGFQTENRQMVNFAPFAHIEKEDYVVKPALGL